MEALIPVDIAHGKLHVSASARAAIQEALLTWPDCRATLTIEKETRGRSVAQNAYYHGVVLKLLSKHFGGSPDDIHEALKVKFLPKDVVFKTGVGRVVAEFVIGGSTTVLTSVQFSDYIERIRQWAFEDYDVDIPPGDPEWRSQQAVA